MRVHDKVVFIIRTSEGRSGESDVPLTAETFRRSRARLLDAGTPEHELTVNHDSTPASAAADLYEGNPYGPEWLKHNTVEGVALVDSGPGAIVEPGNALVGQVDSDYDDWSSE